MKFTDILALAFRTVRSNKLRTGITVAIIAFGIMSLIGIITAIQAMNQKFTESFSSMGANGFSIRYKERNVVFGNGRPNMELSKKGARKEKVSSLNRPITRREAEQFAAYYDFPATVGISTMAGRDFVITCNGRKTDPNVFLFGCDEQYLQLNGFDLLTGRNFSASEIKQGAAVCMLGFDVANKLVPRRPAAALGKVVRINNLPHTVIGVLQSKGSSFGFSRDNVVLSPYAQVNRYFPVGTFTMGVKTADVNAVEAALGEAEGLFRAVRKLSVTEENNFVVERSNAVAEQAINVLGYLTAAVIIIGFITLIGSAIGLMNIMLVSVAERTKEVGLVKAIGGKSSTVRRQFLTESVFISLSGAVIGIVLGVGVGNLFSLLLNTGFVVPWMWVVYGVVICTLVGLLAGGYPAWKAGGMNPIEALRYE